MDKTVPHYAGIILDFIADPESRGNYNCISSNKQNKLSKPITKMTLRELLKDMQTWRKRLGTLSSAAGRYQIIYATLVGLIKELGLNLDQKFDANLQDRLAYHLLKRRGLDRWLAGEITNTQFALRLAQEWASLPVLTKTPRTGKRPVTRGESYYAGDKLNKAHVKAEAVEAMLEAAWSAYKQGVQKPKREKTVEKIGGAVAGGAIAGGAAVHETGITFEQVTNAAALLAPHGVYILGIAAAVGVAYFLYKKWKG